MQVYPSVVSFIQAETLCQVLPLSQLGLSPVAFFDQPARFPSAQKVLLAVQVCFCNLERKDFMLEFRLDEERAVEDIAQLLRERKGGGGPLGEQLALSDAIPWILTMYSKQPEGDSGARPTYCFPSKALLNLKPGEVLFPLIPKHPRYKMATALLFERFPSLTSLPTTSAIAMVLIVVTARDVGEVKILTARFLQLC